MSTTTPAGPSTDLIAASIATASVPNEPSSSPAATAMWTGCAVQHLAGQRHGCVGERTAVRDDDDPDQATRASRRRSGERARGGVDEERGRRRAWVLVPDAALAEVARPTLAGQHRRGGVAAGAAAAAAAAERRAKIVAVGRARRRARRRPVRARRTSSCRSATALPRATTPSRPARNAAANVGGVDGCRRHRRWCRTAGRTCRAAARSRHRPC